MIFQNEPIFTFIYLICIRPVEYNDAKTEHMIMSYISASQAAEKWCISQRRVQILCAEGRISGAIIIGSFWAIPEESVKPCDERMRDNEKQ